MKLQAVDLSLSPEDVALSLSHLDGLCFFDTSGNLPTHHVAPISVIAARPQEIFQGDIANPHPLRKVLRQKSGLATTPTHLPCGGLCGTIDYDGRFCFGLYEEMLIYCHGSHSWWEVGDLSSEMKPRTFSEPFTLGDWQASLSEPRFIEAVNRAKNYIAAGDIYQVNLSRRLRTSCSAPEGLFELYQKLRLSSPAPQASYLKLGGREILSSSPESFLRIDQNRIETRPIKGTRPRFQDPDEDAHSAAELQSSEKERAELVMITDLLRNDLGQVCQFGTVEVSDMLRLETLQHVYHLVSVIKGTLASEEDHLSALAACFPGGSITGAPKKRAMEIIDELEPAPRGLYTGALGYLGFNQVSQFNIAIRTMIFDGENLDYHVGSGIVADSDPEAEYQETEHKARGVRLALEGSLKA